MFPLLLLLATACGGYDRMQTYPEPAYEEPPRMEVPEQQCFCWDPHNYELEQIIQDDKW